MRLTLNPILERLSPNRRRKAQAADPIASQPQPTRPPEPAYALPSRPPEPISVKDPEKQPTDPLAALNKFAARVTANRIVSRLFEVLDIAGKSGTGLFAAALAYGTLFAMIPTVLLMAGVLGWLVDDPVQRQQVLKQLVSYFPPLAEFFSAALNGLVSARGALSVVGIVGLIWGASAFYGSLDEVMRRIFVGGGVRGELDRRVRGVITIVGVLVLMIGSVVLSGVFAFVHELVGDLAIVGVLAPLIALAVSVIAVLAIYLLVPTAPPSLHAALPPAIVAGVGIGVLTNLFGVLAPLLIGGLAGLGVIATAFGLLVWLNFGYQILLLGAAWARLRRDLERDRRSVVTL